ncbi:hypothetical protein TKK_0013511 [Trichogramma kaykai]
MLLPNVVIIHGFFYLTQLKQLPQKFGQLSLKILQEITSNAAEQIVIIFDKYTQPSIDECQHLLGDTLFRDFIIKGPEQNRPSDFSAELKNTKFREVLISFLIEHWNSQAAVEYLENNKLYVSFDKCLRFTVTDGSVQCQIMHDYKCQGHVKAATKIPFFVSRTNDHNTVVEQCDNTDTMIILLGKMMDVSDTVQVWLEFGTGNNRRFINMNECFKSLGLSICKAIPAFHSFTGSFNDIQNPARDSYESAVDVLQEFVCQMYATKKNGLAYCTRVNEARENLFIHNYGSAEHTEQFQKKLLSIDGCTLPPCKRELDQHILRASYISSFWSNANCEVLHDLDATEYGWTLNDAAYLFKWYEGKEMPD